ncbi:velum formation- protein [Ciborinia camelliae]|nr:velum formation- protein [Ciborinia camelliae]
MTSPAAPKSKPEIILRTTKGGKKLRYTLTVIQQPERARACGSGAKSSADRRPVDPPPVVQLRIHDETEPRQEKEITFHYNANFFLFATLEVARPIAQGRVQTSAPQAPVLTGMPVSGMAYLDRPNEAGYFIFPDLSVRHEGQYKLSFNLYEETKEEKDADIESSNESSMRKMSSAAAAAESSFDWRMELKSDQFTVYSAKKFPGLSESTDLSRTVAEQGCRVRIRRDVRMRRRDTKPGGDFGENEDEYVAQRGRAISPPLDYTQLNRQGGLSVSGNEDSQQRRGSGEFSSYHSPVSSPYRSPSGSPSTPNAPPPAGGQLHWMGPGGYIPGQAIQPPLPPPPQASSAYPQPTAAVYPNQGPSTPFRQSPQGPPPPPPGNYAGFEERQPYSQYRPPTNLPQPQSYESDYRRMSFGYQMSPAPQSSPPIAPAVQNPSYSQQPMEPTYNRNPPASAYQNTYQDSVALAPLRAEQPAAISPLVSVKSISTMSRGTPHLAPAPSPIPNYNYNRPERSGSYSHHPPSEAELARPANKRGFNEVFNTTHEPLYNGRRPSDIRQEEEEAEERMRLQMTYRRANGDFSQKLPPSPN